MAYLKILLPDGSIHRHELTGPTRIGRGADCDLCLADQALSRRHCVVEQEGQEWVVKDLGSRNGTYVGRNRIQHQRLLDGSVLHLGHCRMIFHALGHAVTRPRSPDESIFAAKLDNELHRQDHPPVANLPVPRPKPATAGRVAPTVSPGAETVDLGSSSMGSLAFKRPPARPKVKDPPGDS